MLLLKPVKHTQCNTAAVQVSIVRIIFCGAGQIELRMRSIIIHCINTRVETAYLYMRISGPVIQRIWSRERSGRFLLYLRHLDIEIPIVYETNARLACWSPVKSRAQLQGEDEQAVKKIVTDGLYNLISK